MARSAKKCDKNMALQKEKLKKAIEQGNMEGARIYGQNVIREKNQSLNFLRLGSRIDAVASRLVIYIASYCIALYCIVYCIVRHGTVIGWRIVCLALPYPTLPYPTCDRRRPFACSRSTAPWCRRWRACPTPWRTCRWSRSPTPCSRSRSSSRTWTFGQVCCCLLLPASYCFSHTSVCLAVCVRVFRCGVSLRIHGEHDGVHHGHIHSPRGGRHVDTGS